MARRARRSPSRRRSRSLVRSGGRRARRRSGGFGGGGLSKWGIATPNTEALYLGLAQLGGEIVVLLAAKWGFSVPDAIPEAAAGVVLYGIWKKDARIQQFGYSMIAAEALEDMDFFDTIKESLGLPTSDDEADAAAEDEVADDDDEGP